jgi:hypothetical protein
MSQFRKTNTDLMHLEIDGIIINNLRDFAEAFSKRFHPVYSNSCPGTFPFIDQCTKVLS